MCRVDAYITILIAISATDNSRYHFANLHRTTKGCPAAGIRSRQARGVTQVVPEFANRNQDGGRQSSRCLSPTAHLYAQCDVSHGVDFIVSIASS
jgi:hypothetical protein